MKNCININHPDVTILASELNLPKIVVAAKIGVWQEEHNILDRFPTTEELFTNSIINKNIVKPGVQELFDSNSELAQIGTPEQYSQYLDSIFPDSKVKDIVYHGSKEKSIENGLKPAHEGGFLFVTEEKRYADIYSQREGGNTFSVLINSTKNLLNVRELITDKNSPLSKEFQEFLKKNKGYGYNIEDYLEADPNSNTDLLPFTNRKFLRKFYEQKGFDGLIGWNEIALFEPEQIHILGSKQDIEGFKKFVQGKNIESTTDSQTSITLPQKEISHYSIRKLILENIKSDYQDLSKDSNKPDYQRITDNTISNFEKLSKREQETLTKNITHLSNKLSAITGISFQIINDPEQRFKGTLNNGKAIINLAYVTNDTPIHEILGHPIIRYIKTNNSELYNNLVNEINNSEQGTQVLNSTKSKYNDKSEDDIMEESIVELLSLMISNDINEQETGLLKLLKDIYAFFKNIVNTIFDNEVQINDNMNFEELSNFLSNKIKGYENEADTYIRDIVRQMFNLELGNEIFEQRQETVIPSPIENAFEYFKKEFGETNAKEFRNINGAYDNPQMFTDFLNDLIPEKKHVKYILENNVSVIQNLFNRVLIKNEIQEDVVETRTPEEIAKSIGYEFYRINDVFELLQYKKLYNAGSVICTYNNPQNRLESSFIFILKRSYADLVVPVFKLTQEYLKQNHEGAKLWREFLIKDNRLKEDGSFDLRNLSIKREDPYGTSIMNIQILRQGGSQKVLNRYNHASALNYPALTSPDYTYSGDLNNLVIGLQDAIRNIEGVPKSKNKSVTPSFNGKVVERQGKLYAFDFEEDGIYYNKYGFLNNIGYHRINTNEEMIFGKYFINFKLKKAIIFNDMIIDSDIDEIRNAMKNMSSNGTFRIGNITSNEIYLVTSHKNKITLHNPDTNNNESIIFTIEKGNIKMLETNYKTIYKGSFKHMYSLEKVVFSNALKIQDDVLEYNKNVKILEAPFVTEINSGFLYSNTEMEYLYLPNLRKVGPNFLFANEKLKTLDLPNLEFVEHNFLMSNIDLTILRLPKVKTIDDSFLYNNTKLKILDLPNLEIFGLDFLKRNTDLELLFLPKIKDLNNTKLLQNNESLRSLYAPNTEEIGHITFPKKTKLKSLYFPKLKFQETVAQSYQFITSISENKQIKHLYISQDNNIAKIQGSNLLRNLRNSLLESSELDILENIDEHKEIAKRESEGLHELYMSFENPKEFLAIYEQYFGVHPNRTISDFIDYAIDLKLKENSIQSKYQKAEQSILTPQQIQNIQEVNKPIYIGGFSTEGRGTLEGDGKDKQMRKDSVGFIGELNPNKSDRFESSTYGSFLHFNSNPVIVQEDRLIYSLPDNINKGNKIMLALNGSVPDTDLLDKTKQLLLDLHNKGFEFIVGDMPSDHANNRLGDDDFVRYLQSIGANYTVYGNGKESRIPLTFDKILTEQQRQNIQELKQIEPAYAVASDEKVQEFIESIIPDSKVKDIVWHGGKRGITKYDKKYIGKNEQSFTKAFYFNSDSNEANNYRFYEGNSIKSNFPIQNYKIGNQYYFFPFGTPNELIHNNKIYLLTTSGIKEEYKVKRVISSDQSKALNKRFAGKDFAYYEPSDFNINTTYDDYVDAVKRTYNDTNDIKIKEVLEYIISDEFIALKDKGVTESIKLKDIPLDLQTRIIEENGAVKIDGEYQTIENTTTTYPNIINIQNSFIVIDDTEYLKSKRLIEQLSEIGYDISDINENQDFYGYLIDSKKYETFTDFLKNKGYDSFIIQRKNDIEYQIFEPEQITILNSPETIQKWNEFLDKPKYQKDVNQKLASKEQQEKTIALSQKIASLLNLDIQIVNDVNSKYKGKITGNKVFINIAYADTSTPLHELLGHPVIAHIKQTDIDFYNKLINELTSTDEGNAILERVKEDYSELSESEQIEEAIVEYLSIIADKDLSKSAFRKLLDKILEFINKAFNNNYSTIPSFQELSNDLQDYINQVERDFHRDIDAISELFFKSNLNTYHSKLPILETLNGAEGMKLLKKTFGETNAKKIVEFIPSAKVLAIPFVNLVNELFIDPTQIDDFMSRDQNLIKLNEIFEDKINPTGKKEPILLNPFEIVKEKGYTLTEAKTVKDMLVFKKDYDKGYTICTFNDNNGKDRLTKSHILWLRKDYASDILPYNMLTQEYLHSESKDAEAWRNYLKEKKMYNKSTDTYTIPKNPSIYDPYAISSVSIQFSRDPNSNLGRKMVNRYNHAVDRFDGSADYAFKNNLDNVVPNLKNSLRHYLGLKLDLSGIDYDDNVQMVSDKIFVYRREIANTYVNKNSYLRYDQVHFINKDHQILMSNGLIFDFKAKTITNLDGNSTNELFTYNSKIIDIIKNQNKINIILENSEYVTIVIDNNNNIIKLESNVNQIPYGFLYITNTIEEIILSSVTNINDEFLKYNTSLKKLELPKVKTVGNQFLSANTILSSIYLPLVTRVGNNFLASNKELTSLNLPHLEYIGSGVLQINKKIQSLTLPKVSRIGNQFMAENSSLREFNAPLLKTVGDNVLSNNIQLRYLNLPLLEGTGINFLTNNRGLRFLYFPNLNSINNQSFNSIEKGAYLYFPNLYYIADSAFNILSNSFLRTIPKSTYIPNTTDPHAYYGNMKDIIAKTFVESHGEIISKLALKYGSYKFQKYFNDYLIKNLRGTLEEFEKASDLIINNENEIAITTESTVEEVAERMKQRFGIDYELLDDAEFEQRLIDTNVKYESKVVPPLATITDEELEKSLQKSIENEIADYERLIVNGEEITPETMKKDKNVYNLYQDIVRYDQFIAEHFTSTETKNLFNPSVATLIKHFVVKYNVDISPLLTPKPFDIKEYIKIIHSLNKEISEITSTLKYKTNPNDNPELYKQYPFTIKTLFELKIAAVGTIWLQLNSKTDEYKLNDLKFVVDDTERLTHSFSLKLYNNRDSVGYIESTTQIESTGVNHEYVKTSERLGQRLYRGFSWGLKSVSDEHVISYKNFVPITVNNNEDIHAYNAWERWVEKGIAIDKGQYYQILKQKDNVSTRGFYDPYLRKAILRKNGATLSTPIHEAFSHPFIELVKVENPDLYENLLNRARYISEIKSHVDSVYSDVSQDVRDKEYIAHAIDLYYKIELNNHEYYGLIDAIRQFLTYISNALKSILNIDNLEIKDIPLDITLQDLSRYIIYGKGTINLNRNPIVLADNGQPSKLHKTLTKLIGVIPGINNNEDVMEIYNKTKTPEFKEWFKDSVLIDDNNEPLLFFHSGASNINSFDKPSKRFNYTFFHQLILPINNSNSTRQIYPVFLKSVNPYELNDFGAFITTVSVKLPFKNNDSHDDQVIKENNHDSVIDYPSYQKEFSEDLYNDNIPLVITEDYRSNDDESPFDAWQRLMEASEIAIPKSKSYNIKSIFNSGTWNSEDEDIYADKVEKSLQSNTSRPYLKNSEFKKRYSGNVIDILNNIMKSGHILSPLIQELLKAPDARKILNSLSTIVITPGSSIYNKYAKDANDIREQKGLSPINLNGLYIHDSKTIAMVNNIIDPNFSDTTFIHEVIHALTKEKIDTEYYKEWTAIYDYVWGKLKDNGINPKDYYAMSNPHELMTGIFTKSDFMKLLASIPGENNTSLFQDIINFFKRILKINNISLLEEVMNEAMNLINNKPVSRKYIDYINSEIGQAVVNNDPIMNYIHGDKADYIDLIESQDNIPEEQPFVRYKYSPLEVKSYINENELINKRVYKQSELNLLLKKVNTINSKQGYTRYKIIKRNDDNYVIIDNIDNEKVETIKKDLLKDKYKKDDYGLNVPWYYYADEIKDRNVIFKHKDIYFSLGKDAFLYMMQNNIDPEYTNQVKNKFSKDLDISNTEYNTLSDIVYKNNNIYLKIINNEPAYIPDYKGILIKKDVPLLFYKGKNLNINKVGTPVLINTKDITIDNNGVVTSDNLPIIELDYDKTITNERKLSNPDYYINTIYNDLKLSAYLTIEEADNISNNIQLKLKRDNQLYDINFRKNGDYVKINMQMNEDNKINVLKNFNPELVGKLVDMNIDVYNMDQNYLQALYNLTTNDLNNDLTCSI